MAHRKRKTLFVDQEVQTAILKRVVFYWISCIAFFTLMIWCYESLARPDQMFYEHIGPMIRRFLPIYIAMTALLPFLLYDALRFSNRFCGPLHRVLSELEKFSQTGNMERVTFRENDFWQALADRITQAIGNTKDANSLIES